MKGKQSTLHFPEAERTPYKDRRQNNHINNPNTEIMRTPVNEKR